MRQIKIAVLGMDVETEITGNLDEVHKLVSAIVPPDTSVLSDGEAHPATIQIIPKPKIQLTLMGRRDTI